MGKVSLESLPLGFRFRPTDEELINHYLRFKINGRHADVHVIPEIDVCKWEPWDLPGMLFISLSLSSFFYFDRFCLCNLYVICFLFDSLE